MNFKKVRQLVGVGSDGHQGSNYNPTSLSVVSKSVLILMDDPSQ